jgi:predicted NodU family carbamoyl transferase
MAYILGLKAYHSDSSSCILKDGILIAVAEEERFLRTKMDLLEMGNYLSEKRSMLV